MRDLLYDLLYDSSLATTPLAAVQNLAVALILGFLICITYRITFSGVAYSKKFNSTLLMLTLITTMVMNILGSNLALSLGMVGALSIVRFRTAVKDPRDTAYIFWTISVGLGAGSGNYVIVVIGTLFVASACLLSMFGLKSDESYLIIIRGNNECTDAVRSVLFTTYRACKLRAETITDDYVELVYQIKLKKPDQVKKYEDIRKVQGVSFVNMVSKSGEVLG